MSTRPSQPKPGTVVPFERSLKPTQPIAVHPPTNTNVDASRATLIEVLARVIVSDARRVQCALPTKEER